MRRHLAVLAFACLASSAAHATPLVNLAWDACAGPIMKTVTPGGTPSLYVSVLGQTEGHQGYEFRVRIRSWCGADGPIGTLPDAWRFGDGGCPAAGLVTIDHLPVNGIVTCPAFQGVLASQQAKSVVYDALLGVTSIFLANAYPPGIPNPDPATTYFLGRITFDQANGVNGPGVPGVSCGGLETPVCLNLEQADWLDLSQNQHPWNVGNECVSANDPTAATACYGRTPARAATWGAIKGQYR
jgi:hypothetical protein